jgi:hypothetical protein
VQLEGLGKFKKSVHLIRSQTHDLPACHILTRNILIYIILYYYIHISRIDFEAVEVLLWGFIKHKGKKMQSIF